MFDNLYDILKEKGTNPATCDKVCIEVAPRSERDYDLFTYYYEENGEKVIFSYNQVGKVTYKEMLELTDLFIKHQKLAKSIPGNDIINYTPLTICKKVYLDYVAIFIADLKLHYTPVLFPLELDESDFNNYAKYNHFFEKDPADFYVFSSGSTGLLNKPKPVYEKDLIKQIVNDYIIKNNITGEKFYSTMSMNGIAGVTFNAFFPIVTNNSIYISDNENFFENIFHTKSTMFVLPLNYMDFLPLKDKSCNDYSHVKYILISGGYFNTNDINNLLENLPGLKKEAIVYLYSSTEFEGKSTVARYNELNPISLSMPNLLNDKVVFSDDLDSVSYLSSGYVGNMNCKIVDKEKNILGEDEVGTITFDNIETDDIGLIHNKMLYVIGRKKDNEKYNLSIISNYFRYHLNSDVATGIYDGQLMIFVDIINNYYSPYVKELNARRGVYNSYKDNFLLRDKANELIKYLEDNFDFEFYGDVILHKFERNERLEKIRFDYKKYDPFDYDFNNTNGANLFDTYYFISSNFERLFIVEIMNILCGKIPIEVYNRIRETRDIFDYMPINRVYECFKRIDENDELIEKIKKNKDIYEVLREVLYSPGYLSLDFLDMHHFDINHSNKTAKQLMNDFETRPRLYNDEKNMVRDLVCIVRDLQDKLEIKINDKDYYSNEMYEKRRARSKSCNGPFINVFELISFDMLDDFVDTLEEENYRLSKKNKYNK